MASRVAQVWALMYPDGIPVEDFEFAASLVERAKADAPPTVDVQRRSAKRDIAERRTLPKVTVEVEVPLSVAEASNKTGRNKATIYAAIKSKKLKAVSVNGKQHINPSALREWAA